MTQLEQQRVSGLLAAWRAGRQLKRGREKAVSEAIELIVEGTDPRIRVVRGYQSKLRSAVERTLAFIEEIVACLPAPIELSRRSWQKDPTINALFATTEDVRRAVSGSKDLRDYFQRNMAIQKAFALLTATRQEKTVVGMALQEDVLQRDVLQTSVSFTDHRIFAGGDTEECLREAVKKRALNLFINHAQARLLDLQLQCDGLERERQVLQIRLKLLRTRAQSLEAVEDDSKEIEELDKKLAENTKSRESSGGAVATMEGVLEQVRSIFANPETHLANSMISFRVNRAGIKLDEQATESGNHVRILEFSMGQVKRVATLVICLRDEMLSVEQLVQQMNPNLASELGIRNQSTEKVRIESD